MAFPTKSYLTKIQFDLLSKNMQDYFSMVINTLGKEGSSVRQCSGGP
jgi:hypothetical protein